MKARILQVSGGLILLACMAFAIRRLDSADAWILGWIPFVVVGAGLALTGALMAVRNNTGNTP